MIQTQPYFLQLEREEQKAILEALIFASEEPLNNKSLMKILIFQDVKTNGKNYNSDYNLDEDDDEKPQGTIENEIRNKYNIGDEFFHELVNDINNDLSETGRPFEIIMIGGGWQYATRKEYGEIINKLDSSKHKRKLSQASLEVLSIVAYRQPVTKPELEQIRGVNSSDVINSLMDKGLVKIVGRRKTLGKPLLYGTTPEFLKAFGLNSLEDLPKLREFDELGDPHIRSEELNLKISLDENQKEKLDELNESEFLSVNYDESDESDENQDN